MGRRQAATLPRAARRRAARVLRPRAGRGNSGTDARFPSENRQVVVIGESPGPNGVQGVAGSDRAVPIQHNPTAHKQLSLVSRICCPGTADRANSPPNSFGSRYRESFSVAARTCRVCNRYPATCPPSGARARHSSATTATRTQVDCGSSPPSARGPDVGGRAGHPSQG
jgi:hypothetical protein